MARTRLFISHSSPDAASRQRLDDICTALTQCGYDPLADRAAIQSGDEWRHRIHVMLAECQAGVLLLDPAAIGSPWVLKEATILAWRRDLEPDFHLVPVRFRGITVADLEARHYAPLLLTELQHVIADDSVAIVSAVRQRVPAGSDAPSLFDLMVADMTVVIERLSVSDLTLEEICRKCEPSIQFTAGQSRKHKFASVLARRLLTTGPECIAAAVELFDNFGPAAQRDVLRRLASLIEPLWVDSEAAALLPVVSRRQGDARDLALYCSKSGMFTDFVARDYVRRAFLRSSKFRLTHVDDGHAGDVAEYVARRLRESVRSRPPYRDFSDDEIDRHLSDERGKDPMFVLLPAIVDDDALESLRNTFPRVTFLMRTDAAGKERPELPSRVRYVEPELSPEVERDVLFGRDRLTDLLNNLA
jgi:hypothetical protein